MQLTIKPKHQQIIEATLRTGRFQSADQVVEHALELLRDFDRTEAERVDALRRDINVAIDQADRGECTPWNKDAFLARMHKEHEERQGGRAL